MLETDIYTCYVYNSIKFQENLQNPCYLLDHGLAIRNQVSKYKPDHLPILLSLCSRKKALCQHFVKFVSSNCWYCIVSNKLLPVIVECWPFAKFPSFRNELRRAICFCSNAMLWIRCARSKLFIYLIIWTKIWGIFFTLSRLKIK